MKTHFEEQFLKSHQSLEKTVDGQIFVDKKLITDLNSFEPKIGLAFLLEMFKDNSFYEKMKNLLENNSSSITLTVVDKNAISSYLSFTKNSVISHLKKVFEENSESLTLEQVKAFDELIVTSELFNNKQKICDGEFQCYVKGKLTKVQKGFLFQILEWPQNKYEAFLNNPKSRVNKFSRDEFLFLFDRFSIKEELFNKYYYDDVVQSRLEEVKDKEKIDFEYVGVDLKNDKDKKFLSLYDINPSLRRHVLKGMPSNLTKLEKAVYIYLKLCRTFEYDLNFHLNEQQGKPAKLHENFDRLKTLTKENNEVVCYDFNAVYAKFLNDLGLEFRIERENPNGFYGGERPHAKIRFVVDKFIVGVDSVNRIFSNDMFLCKIGDDPLGIYTLNKSAKTSEEFEKVVLNINKELKKQDLFEKINNGKFDLDDKSNYIHGYSPIFGETKQDEQFCSKIDWIMNQVDYKNLGPNDRIFYLLKLEKDVFLEDSKHIDMVVVREKLKNQETKPTVIMTLAKDKNKEGTKQYYVLDEQKWEHITKKDLQKKFDDKTYSYAYDERPFIPGIKAKEPETKQVFYKEEFEF